MYWHRWRHPLKVSDCTCWSDLKHGFIKYRIYVHISSQKDSSLSDYGQTNRISSCTFDPSVRVEWKSAKKSSIEDLLKQCLLTPYSEALCHVWLESQTSVKWCNCYCQPVAMHILDRKTPPWIHDSLCNNLKTQPACTLQFGPNFFSSLCSCTPK